MATKSIRVDTEVVLELLRRSSGETPNQVMRKLLGLPQVPFPKGGASRKLLIEPATHIARAEKHLIKAFQELRKTERTGA